MISFCKFCSSLTSGPYGNQYCQKCRIGFAPNRITFYVMFKDRLHEIDVDLENKKTTLKKLQAYEFEPEYLGRYTSLGNTIMTVNHIPPELTIKRVEEWARKLLKLTIFS